MSQLDTGGFLDLLFDGAPEGSWVALTSFPGGSFDPTPGAGPTQETWFKWPEQRADMVVTAKMNKRSDLYVSPVVFKSPSTREMGEGGKEVRVGGRRKDNALWVGVVYADADKAAPRVFKLKPTIEVETSPGSYHLYWKVTNSGDVQRLTRSGRAMAYAHQDEGCDLGGWDITQLLRVPGSTNNKPNLNEPWIVKAQSSGEVYTAETIEQAYPTSASQELPEQETTELPRVLPDYSLCYAKVAENPKMIDLLNAVGRAPTKERQGNRSALLWKLVMDLARAGLTREEAFVLSWPVKYNKFRTEGRSRSYWWEHVCKAYDKLSVEEPAEQPEDTSPKKTKLRVKAVELLTKNERGQVPITWIDRYKAWGATRTDADLGFQEGAAWTVLSSVMGEFGRPATRFESNSLNLWLMVLGGTTLSRKSTVKGMMLKTLRAISTDQYDYDAGSDATREGLTKFLSERPGWTSLFHRDEVHGLNEESDKKNYMAGFQQLVTELYDGTVPGTLRAGDQSQPKGTRTNFCMYFTGVTDHVLESYSPEDFASGHLARFMWVNAEPRQMNDTNLHIEQLEEPTEEEKKKLSYGAPSDRAYQALLDELVRARDHWSRKTDRGKQIPIYWETAAWERFNQIQKRAMYWADKHPLNKALLPTVQRSVISLIKMSSILAMLDRVERVQLRHLYRAAEFLEESLTHLTVILGRMHTSKRAALLDEIVTEVRLSGEKGITKSKLFGKFNRRYTASAFWPMVADLLEAGDLHTDGGSRFLVRKE